MTPALHDMVVNSDAGITILAFAKGLPVRLAWLATLGIRAAELQRTLDRLSRLADDPDFSRPSCDMHPSGHTGPSAPLRAVRATGVGDRMTRAGLSISIAPSGPSPGAE